MIDWQSFRFPCASGLQGSAGCGKTLNLTTAYLVYLLGRGVDVGELLAITFTNKAAGEMKERILRRLSSLAKYSDPEDVDFFSDLLGVSDSEVVERANRCVERILYGYSDFNVSTIDSFMNRMVRAFAIELGLSPSFEVSTDVGKELSFALSKLVDSAPDREDLMFALREFIARTAEEMQGGWQIESLLAEQMIRFWSRESSVKVGFVRVDFCMIEDKRKHLHLLRDEAKRLALDIHGSYGECLHRYVISALEKICRGDFNALKKTEGFWRGWRRVVKSGCDNICGDVSDALEKLRCVAQEILGLEAWLESAYYLLLYNFFRATVEGCLKEQGKLLVSDFSRVIDKLFYGDIPVPFVYYRIGERIKHLLIDEFQDTSRLQWRVMLPLVENALSENGSFIYVGDPKQAIYRWRGGCSELFDDVKEYLRCVNEYPLGYNWRSRCNVVEFNNRFFGVDALKEALIQMGYTAPDVVNVYRGSAQECAGSKGGYVRVEYVEDVKFSLQRLMETEILDRFNPDDVVVLVRRHKEATEVSSWLAEIGINVVCRESFLLSEDPVILSIVELLRFVDDPYDNTSIFQFLVSPVFLRYSNREFSDVLTTLEGYLHRDTYLYAVLEKMFPKEWEEAFHPLLDVAGFVPLYEFVQRVLLGFEVWKHFPQKEAFLYSFTSMVFEFEGNGNSSIREFLRFWEENKTDLLIGMPDVPGAIRVMTMHKAKGLEFPVVVVPFTSISMRISHRDFLYLDVGDGELPLRNRRYLEYTAYKREQAKEELRIVLDNINLMYVAFTRARDELYVFLLSLIHI